MSSPNDIPESGSPQPHGEQPYQPHGEHGGTPSGWT